MPSAAAELDALFAALRSIADPERALKMRAYMKDRYAFVGVTAPQRKQLARPFLNATGKLPASELFDLADRCWAEPEREFQYVATDLLQRRQRTLGAADLDRVEWFIRTKSWWDTVDALASTVVGGIVRRNPSCAATMDEWVHDPNIWIARTAIIHQLKFGPDADADRLFRYAELRADDTEFFIRKAIGWSLRQHARTDPEAVVDFVETHRDRLSGLTKREALKHLK